MLSPLGLGGWQSQKPQSWADVDAAWDAWKLEDNSALLFPQSPHASFPGLSLSTPFSPNTRPPSPMDQQSSPHNLGSPISLNTRPPSPMDQQGSPRALGSPSIPITRPPSPMTQQGSSDIGKRPRQNAEEPEDSNLALPKHGPPSKEKERDHEVGFTYVR